MKAQNGLGIAVQVHERNKGSTGTKGVNHESLFRYLIRNRSLYILLIPGMLYLIIFRYMPMYGLLIAFKDFDVVKGIWESTWIGFKNFQYLFSFPDFYIVFKNSILISCYRILWGFPAPIIMAIMLNEIKNMAYKRTVQTIIYLPHFISWVVIAGIIINFLSSTDGAINYLIQMFGAQPIAFLQDPKFFRSIIVMSDIWKEAGWGTIIYLAAINGINDELYESAFMDGANKLQRIWYITLPGIMSTVVIMLILRMGSVLRNGFEQIFLLYNSMVYDVADVFETFTYRIGIIEGRYEFATAVGIFQSVVGLILIVLTNRLSKKYGEGGLW